MTATKITVLPLKAFYSTKEKRKRKGKENILMLEEGPIINTTPKGIVLAQMVNSQSRLDSCQIDGLVKRNSTKFNKQERWKN